MDSEGSRTGADSVGSRAGAGSGVDSVVSRTGADLVGFRTGADSVGSWTGPGSVGSRTGAVSGADSRIEQAPGEFEWTSLPSSFSTFACKTESENLLSIGGGLGITRFTAMGSIYY